MQLADKVTAITGAASGIGLATARLFAREGLPLEAVMNSIRNGLGMRKAEDRG